MTFCTAGHVDHGKTALVRALTGVDTDRLAEERRRGLTIELGFAPLELPGVGRVSLVDVPGHAQFIPTMLSGCGGLDGALFTVAADEGPMPQTAEHLDILSLLGLERGVVALTRADLASPAARAEAEALTAENGYEDRVMDTGEVFGFWVIEGPQSLLEELPIREAGLEDHILVVDDHTPYKQRKVRILNGAHTAFVPGAFLAGRDIVRDCMEDPVIRDFMETCIYQEIIPTLSLPREDCEAFARAVEERFANPYIDHRLLDIALNSVSKWRARVLPSVTAYLEKTGRLPVRLTFSFAALCAFYTQGQRSGETYPVRDEAAVLEFFAAHAEDTSQMLITALAAQENFWGQNLNQLPGFTAAAAAHLERIRRDGIAVAMEACRKEAAL